MSDIARLVQQREEYICALEVENARLKRKINGLIATMRRAKRVARGGGATRV